MSGEREVSDEAHFAAAAVQQTLGRSSDVDACVALARRIVGLMGDALNYFQKEQGAIACQAGCNFCCHLRVMVYPHEAIALHRHLRSSLPAQQAQLVRERLKSNALRLTQGQAGSDGASEPRTACAFLIGGQCSVYEVRPAACAGYHSLSREACERDHQAAGSAAADAIPSEGIPQSQAMRHVALSLDEGLRVGLNTAGLSSSQVELQTGVAALLAEPALIGRWRAGREWPRDGSGLVRSRRK
jgi:Fe-S-cluster containining protein